MTDRIRQLRKFLASEMAKPFAWGETDCACTTDRWVRSVAGFSPMLIAGRVHGSQQAARDWLAEPGGIAVAVNRVMRAAGLSKTSAPATGDVGLAVHAGRLCMSIFDGRLWLSRDETGFLAAPAEACWKAWKVD